MQLTNEIGVAELKQAGLDLSITNPATSHRRQVGGVDTIVLNVWCQAFDNVHRELLVKLDEAKAKAQERGRDGQYIELQNKILWKVNRTGSGYGCGYGYRVEFDGVTLLINRKNDPESRTPNVVAQCYGGAMMRHGWSARTIWNWLSLKLDSVGLRVVRHSIGRLDAFSDNVGLPSWKLALAAEEGRLVCRARRENVRGFSQADDEETMQRIMHAWDEGEAAAIAALRSSVGTRREKTMNAIRELQQAGDNSLVTFGTGKEGRGFMAGKGACTGRVYDKMTQLKRVHPERVEAMCDAWGCDENTAVTRVEFQLMSPFLRQQGVKTVEDWEARKQSITDYLTSKWMLIADEQIDRKNQNYSRAEISPDWKRVQAVFRSWSKGGTAPRQPIEPGVDDRAAKRFAKTGAAFLRKAQLMECEPSADPWKYRHDLIQMLDRAVCELGDGFDEHLAEGVRQWANRVNSTGGSLSERLRPESEILDYLVDRSVNVCKILEPSPDSSSSGLKSQHSLLF